MRDMRKWMNVDFISALDLLNDDGDGYKSLDLVIDRVSDPQAVKLGPKTEKLSVLSFRRAKKRMILRNVHMRSLVKIFGPDADAMAGKKVRLWVERDVKAFGDVMDCVRFKRCPTGDQWGSRPLSADSLPEVAPLSRREIEAPDDDDRVGGPSGEDYATEEKGSSGAPRVRGVDLSALDAAINEVAGSYALGDCESADFKDAREALDAKVQSLYGKEIHQLTAAEVDEAARTIESSGKLYLDKISKGKDADVAGDQAELPEVAE